MTRIATFCVVTLLIGGCRAPMPSFNVFAPYGSSRVPPPSTGAYGAAGTYYPGQVPGSATSPATIPSTPMPKTVPNLGTPAPGSTPVGSSVGANRVGTPTVRPTGSSAVAPAAFQPSVIGSGTASRAAQPATTPLPGGSTRSGLRAGGMHVNDATAILPPSSPTPNPAGAIASAKAIGGQPPAEPMEISKLPPPTNPTTPQSSGLMQWLKNPQPVPTGAAPSW